MTIAEVIDGVIRREGGYVNDPRDAGGETCWGITVAVARANGWTGPMKDLPRETAAAISSATRAMSIRTRIIFIPSPRFR